MRSVAVIALSLQAGACARQQQVDVAYPAPEPLPALSVQRQLELKAGYTGEPGTMDPFAERPARSSPVASITAHPQVHLERFVLAESVERREPVGVRSEFSPGERIYAFLHLKHVKSPYDLTVRWEALSGERGGADVRIRVEPSPRYRTWSRLRAPTRPGVYRCLVRDSAGERVAEVLFDVAG